MYLFKDSFLDFERNLETLINYLDMVEEQALLNKKLSKDINYENLKVDFPEIVNFFEKTSNISYRIFEYSSIIISLYGSLEHYIENSILEYLEILNEKVESYKSIPKQIIKTHFELSANLINNLKYPKYELLTSQEEIIKNMNSCIIDSFSQYKINRLAFIHHTDNFRKDAINNFYSKVGITNIISMISQDKNWKAFIKETGEDSNEEFYILKDLVERRNRISHGSEEEEILSFTIMKQYIKYISFMVKLLNEILQIELITNLLVNNSGLIDLGQPLTCFPVKTIKSKFIGIEVKNYTFSIGDFIIVKSNRSQKISLVKINSIQVNRSEKESITIEEELLKIAFGLNKQVHIDDNIYVLEK